MKQEDLPSLIKRVHDNAVKHGWHDQKRSEEHCLMMIVTEIAELVEADRKHRYAKPFVIGYECMYSYVIYDGSKHYGIQSNVYSMFRYYEKDALGLII